MTRGPGAAPGSAGGKVRAAHGAWHAGPGAAWGRGARDLSGLQGPPPSPRGRAARAPAASPRVLRAVAVDGTWPRPECPRLACGAGLTWGRLRGSS